MNIEMNGNSSANRRLEPRPGICTTQIDTIVEQSTSATNTVKVKKVQVIPPCRACGTDKEDGVYL